MKNIHTLSSSLDQKLVDMKSFDKTSQTVQEKIAALQKHIEKLRSNLLENIAQLTESRNSKAKHEKELELFLRQEEKLKSNLEEEKTELKQTEKTLALLGKKIERENQKFREKQESLKDNEKAAEKLADSLDKLKAQHANFETQKDKALHHIHALEQLLEKETGTGSSTEVPSSLGLLADLIESETEYTPAVDIFWREEAKAHIVQAHELQRALEEKNIKGNFLLLNSVYKEAPPSEVFQDRRVLGRLKTKIKAHPKIKDHLSSLRDAAIVKDIKDAVELWLHYSNVNYITVNGDVLYSSGLLNMGEKKEGLLALKQEIKTLTKTIEGFDEKLIPLALEIEEKQRDKQRLAHQKEESEGILHQIEKQMDAKTKEKSFILLDKEKTETNLILIQTEIGLLAKDRNSINEKFSSISAKVEDFESTDNALKQKWPKKNKR